MNDVTPPIIVAEGWDVRLFKSAAEALGNLEPIDVEERIHQVFDSVGHRLIIGTDGSRVFVSSVDSNPQHAHDLEALLRGFLERVGENVGRDPRRDLATLVADTTRLFSGPG